MFVISKNQKEGSCLPQSFTQSDICVCGGGEDSAFEREMVTVWQKYKKKIDDYSKEFGLDLQQEISGRFWEWML